MYPKLRKYHHFCKKLLKKIEESLCICEEYGEQSTSGNMSWQDRLLLIKAELEEWTLPSAKRTTIKISIPGYSSYAIKKEK
jgi:hypothetical protein